MNDYLFGERKNDSHSGAYATNIFRVVLNTAPFGTARDF